MMCLFSFYCSLLIVFFFFKQKTAYEMRISDWSSDVCSSDLRGHDHRRVDRERDRADAHLLWLDDPFAADLPGCRDGALLDRVAVPGHVMGYRGNGGAGPDGDRRRQIGRAHV